MIVMFIFFVIILGILWSLPLYVCVNLVLLAFHITYHFTILQALALSSLISVISNLFFKKLGLYDKEDK